MHRPTFVSSASCSRHLSPLRPFRAACAAFFLLGLFALPAPALAGFALILPDTPVVDNPEQNTLRVILGTLEPATGQGASMERPQALTALRFHGEETERSEHLSVLEEVQAYGVPAFSMEIALPQPGVYHFILQNKAVWQPEQDKFVQYVSKLEVPVHGASEGWDKPAGINFEILPMSRPFGLCAGMSFTGQVLLDGKPVAGALVEATALNSAVKADIRPMPSAEELADPQNKAKAEKAKNVPKTAPLSPYQAVQELRADAQGVFTFTCPTPGWWAFAASNTSDSLQDPDGKQKPLETKTIFWVYIDNCKDRAKR